MAYLNLINGKNFRQLPHELKKELVRKIRTILPYSEKVVMDALWDTMPFVEFCHDRPEIVRITTPNGCFETMAEYHKAETQATVPF